MKKLLYIFALIAFPGILIAQNPAPALPQSGAILILNATAHLGNGKIIENSAVGFENGKLILVADARLIKIDASKYKTTIDASGKHVYPGFISCNTTLGLTEIDLVRSTADYNEVGDMNANVRSIISYNTDSKIIPTVRSNGVLKMMQSMTQGVMLRGSVYETGGIHSFWVKSAQKNLIALFFELPTKPVKVGDKWSLDINLITNDQNFDCDSSYKINEVTLADIKKINGETIAVLKYNIVEYVKGNFNTPSFFGSEGGQKETMMKFTHQGIAEFSVDKGRWINYDGIMSLEATGVMTANKKTKFTLIDEQNASR